jgi:hypothetical protein
VDYYDDHRCPPLIQRRKRKESRSAGAKPLIAPIPDGPLIPDAVPAE